MKPRRNSHASPRGGSPLDRGSLDRGRHSIGIPLRHACAIFWIVLAVQFAAGLPGHQLGAEEPSIATSTQPPATEAAGVSVEKHRYTGQVVRLSEALKRRGITAGPEMQGHIVLETASGQLLPILADWRGRAFYQDERLRDRKVTLIANRRSDFGYLQPLMIFTFDEQDRPQFTDYWCDICSIPMYEIQPCECCQGDIRLRYSLQPVPMDVDVWPVDANAGIPTVGGAMPD